MYREYEEHENDKILVKYESDTQLADLALVKDDQDILWFEVVEELDGTADWIEVDDIDLMIDFFQEVVDQLKKEKALQG